MAPALWEALSAGGLGLLIGLERERARLDSGGPAAEAAGKGARTFTLIALYGYGAALLGERYPVLPVVALLGLALLLSALQLARRKRRTEAGSATTPTSSVPPEDVTTEIAALATCVLGLLAHGQMDAAVTLGLLVMAVLLAKPWSRTLVPKLRREELTGTLQLLVALLMVLPLVPDQPLHLPAVPALDGALNPRTVVLFVVLTAAIGYIGYFMVRALGVNRGLPLTGLVGGLTSSTAVTLAMGEHVRAQPAVLSAAATATYLACAVMVVRVVAITLVVSMPLGRSLVLPAAAMLLGYGGMALVLRRRHQGDGATARLSLDNPFALGPALKLGAIYAAALVGARLLRAAFGAQGLYLASALAGMADVDSITLAAARLCKDGAEPLRVGATAIWIGVYSNSAVKSALATSVGGRAYGLRVLLGHAVAAAAGGLALAWQWVR